MSPRRAAGTVAGGAALIAVITVVARIAGFGRTVVFVQAVGADCVGSVYTTVNTLPNIVFDIVAGGMLSALVVPVVAPAFAAGDLDRASRAVSALLGWTLLATAALAVVIAATAPVLVRVLLPDSGCAGAHDLGVRMLVVFAPQVVFYGLGAVLGGALQAAHHFGWPAVAPLLSSLVVIAAYLVYGATADVAPGRADLARGPELVLSVGTTLGVVVLAGCLVVPTLRAGVRIRPTLRFPDGLAAIARRTALAGAAALAAQQLAAAVMLRLANDGTTSGLAVVVTTAQTVFLLPWAVLAVPVATASYPRLATAWDAGDRPAYAATLGSSTRLVTAAAGVATAVLVAVAEPAGALLLSGANTSDPARAQFAPALVAFAVGLLGWSLVALLARSLYATGQVTAAALGQVAGQVVVVVVDLVLAAALPAGDRAFALGLGNAVGVSVAAVWLLVASTRVGAGWPTGALVRAVLGAVAGGVVGWLVGRLATDEGRLAGLGWGLAAGASALAVAGAVAVGTDTTLRQRLVRR
ncbi:murein biosynthesis integral membrane protein MurJ [Jatrophihabitans sp. YIM 134969]